MRIIFSQCIPIFFIENSPIIIPSAKETNQQGTNTSLATNIINFVQLRIYLSTWLCGSIDLIVAAENGREVWGGINPRPRKKVIYAVMILFAG